MKFFIDTADVEEIEKANELAILDGVTTNPSLVAKSNKPFKKVIQEICRIVDGPVSAEVVSIEKEGMLKEARDLIKIAKNVVVKIPLIPEGLKAVKVLSQEGIRTNVTLCFSSTQALLAAKAGATYISPFIGRIDDQGYEGMSLIQDIIQIYKNYSFSTKVLAASIRHPLHVHQAALLGADVVTIPFKVFDLLVKHSLTDVGLKKFLDDAKKMKWE